MEFNNLRRNILARLGKELRMPNGNKSSAMDGIRSDYSDIPETDVEDAIQSLKDNGLILLSSENQSIQLTPKGLDRLQVIKDRKNNDEVILAKEIDLRKHQREGIERR